MAKKQTSKASWLQSSVLRVSRVHFLYILSYMVSIVIFDSWNLYTHDAIAGRWTLAGGLLVVNTVVWYLSRMRFRAEAGYMALVLLLIVADIVFAGTNVYWERGMASKAVALFAVPIVAAAALRSRSTLLAAASLSAAGYSTATVRYFYQHYGEGYRIELYGNIIFYCVAFFILSWLLWIIINPTEERL